MGRFFFAQYILSGQLLVEAQIHKRKLTLFNNVCHQPENSIEKQLAVRQSNVKTMKSNIVQQRSKMTLQ